MKITNLDPSKYKRFFAFGCSFTNYKWPTWADIIGKDFEFYENWGAPGAGNYFIFNSFIEANSRYNFNKDDLIIIMWSTKEREDRYSNNEWIHATSNSIENTYSNVWVSKFYFDTRSQLIRDLAFIKSTQLILDSKECAWANLLWDDFFNGDVVNKDLDRTSLIRLWRTQCKEVHRGNEIPELFRHRDVIKLYQDVFVNIAGVYEWAEEEFTKDIKDFPEDGHPSSAEALLFLDFVWPDNTISNEAKHYANSWDYTHPIIRTEVTRL
jgi:hypothetical protein